ncbi:hypothetical protein [Pseudomonas bohemica]|uniref:hypothetical protein n=1 Tax=Pseudomonas bohemica TaxID=2044872 RepID=UPI0018FEB3BA|nr:hypothetical protein [Pseudomonas bohemica]
MWQPLAAREIIPGSMNGDYLRELEVKAAIAPFCADVIYDHYPLSKHLNESTYSFTFLREPVQRLLSQIKDWRRLRVEQISAIDPDLSECITDASELSINDFLIRYHHSPIGALLDNYQVKAIAASSIGLEAYSISDMSQLLDIALLALNENFNFVGLAERHFESRTFLASQLTVPPVEKLANLNVAAADPGFTQQVTMAGLTIERCTKFDVVLYDEARRLFESSLRGAEKYDFARFETRDAERVLAKMAGYPRDAGIAFSVRDAVYGEGFHSRDAPGGSNCALWGGPGLNTVLYMPVAPDAEIEIMLWIRGYADETIRENLKLAVDGVPVEHFYSPAAGALEVLTGRLKTQRPFVRLEITANHSVTSPGLDERHRTFCFDSYGWRMR